jgi:hypothetical protein
MNDYEKQAANFLESTGATITTRYVGHRPYWPDDTEQRAVWEITLSREGRKPYVFTFGESIHDSYEILDLNLTFPRKMKSWPHDIYNYRGYKAALEAGGGEVQGRYRIVPTKIEPTPYSVLAILDANSPESFEGFCSDFGYDTDSRKALDTFLAVQKQTGELRRLFTTKELEQLSEIV